MHSRSLSSRIFHFATVWLQEALKKVKSNKSGGKNEKVKQTSTSEKGKRSTKAGKGFENLAEEKDSDEECGDDDDESKASADSVKRAQEKSAKLVKSQQKTAKSKAGDIKDEMKSDKVKLEQTQQSKVSL